MPEEISDTILRVIQLILPSKTQRDQDMTTTEHHTKHQPITLKVESPALNENLVDEEEAIGKTLVNEEEELNKSLGIDQGGKDSQLTMIRDLGEASSASFVTYKDTPAYFTAQNSQSTFLEGLMQRAYQRISAPSVYHTSETVTTGNSEGSRTISARSTI